jgi:hypothetical protein
VEGGEGVPKGVREVVLDERDVDVGAEGVAIGVEGVGRCVGVDEREMGGGMEVEDLVVALDFGLARGV